MVQQCNICRTNISPRSLALKCRQCHLWHHVSCLNLSEESVDYFLIESKKDRGDRFICAICSPEFSSPQSSASFTSAKSANNHDTAIETTIKSVLAAEFQKLRQEFMSSIQRELAAANVKIETLNKECKALKAEISILKASQATQMQDTVRELEEQKIRAKNIMIFELAEDADSDMTKVTAILGTVVEGVVPKKVVRVGKRRNDKPRPLKVILTDSETASNILKQSKRIADKARVNVKADLTPGQQSYLKNLQTELHRRISNGESNLTIKYIRRIPQIVAQSRENA